MKYTKLLWYSDLFPYHDLIYGKNRRLLRIPFALLNVIFELLCICLTLETIPIDIFRICKARWLFYNHFRRNYKPYVLQQYIT